MQGLNKTLRSPRDFTNWLDGFLHMKEELSQEDIEEINGAAEDVLMAMDEDLAAKRPATVGGTQPTIRRDWRCSIEGCTICFG